LQERGQPLGNLRVEKLEYFVQTRSLFLILIEPSPLIDS
jgi:hypothetical protein